jgi:protein SCO1/2
MKVHPITIAVASFMMSIAAGCSNNQQDTWSQLPTIKTAPAFTVVNYDGTQLSSTQLEGKPWVASFMFARCQGVCPTMNGVIADLQREFGGAVRFVSFSVDPENDSLPVLAEYARQYGAKPGQWFITRTSLDSVRALSRDGFLLSDPVTPDLHSSRLALVDEHGMIRGYFNSLDTADVDRLRSILASYVATMAQNAQ